MIPPQTSTTPPPHPPNYTGPSNPPLEYHPFPRISLLIVPIFPLHKQDIMIFHLIQLYVLPSQIY